LTTTLTLVPCGRDAPARGRCEAMSPRRSFERAYETCPNAQCARRSKIRAFATVLPLSLGTTQRAVSCTVAAGAEAAEALPAALGGVTTTRRIESASAEVTR